MSTTLKVLSAKKVIASHQINQGDTLVIDARDKSNYQLIDDQTGFAPQNIIAKREGKDLKIFLEDGDMNPDVVIKGYYGDENSEEVTNLLVGQHENGGVYAYVPESGLKADAVSMLAEEVAAPQALGGEDLASAFWAFNPWWLLALVPLAAGIAIAASSGGSSGGSSNNGNNDTTADKPGIKANNDGSVTVTPGSDNTKVNVTFKDENGKDKTVTAEKGADGKWSIPDAGDTGATIDPDTGVVTIPSENIKDGSTVTATGTDDKGNTATNTGTVADSKPGDSNGDGVVDDKDDSTEIVTLPGGKEVPRNTDGAPNIVFGEDENNDGYINAKEIIGKDGKDTTPVYITIPEKTEVGDTLVVTVNGKEKSIPVTPEMIEKGFTQVDVPVNGDGPIEVTAKVTDPAGQSSNEGNKKVEVDTGVPGDTNDDKTPGKGDNSGENTNVPIIDENGDEGTLPVDKNTNGAPNIVFSEDRNGDDILNKTEIGSDNSTPVQITIPDRTAVGDTLVVTINGKEEKIPVTEEMVNKGYTTVTIPITQDGEIKVTAKVVDPAGNESATGEEAVTVDTSEPTDPADKPTIESPDNDGKVTVTPGDDNNKVEVTFTGEDDQPKTVVAEKGDDGKWSIPDAGDTGATVDPDTGVITIPSDKVKDGEPVNAKGTNDAGNTADADEVKAGTDAQPEDPADPPTITSPNNDGTVTVKPGDDNKKVEVTFTGEDDQPKTVVAEKDKDGKWSISDAGDTGATVDPDTGVITIPSDKVKDGEPVNAKGTNDAGNTADADTVNAGSDTEDPADKPTIESPDNDGKVTVTPGDDNNKVEVTFTGEDDQPKTVVAEKGDDGKWSIPDAGDTGATVDPDTGVITIPSDKVKDGEPVNAKGTNDAGNTADADTVNAGSDAEDPADKPTIESPDNDGKVTVTPGDDNNKVEVTFTGEDDQPKTVVAEKGDDGKWSIPDAGDTGATVDPDTGVITIPSDKVKDGEPVNAKGTNDAGNTADADTVNAGTDPKDASVDNTNGDGVVSTTPVNEGDSITTTVKLTNNNGNEKLPFSLPNGTADGELGESDFADKSEFTFSNGVTLNPDGTLNVPAGVTEFTITTPVKEDNTAEGEEKGKFTVGGVPGNEVTVNDAMTPEIAKIDASSLKAKDDLTDETANAESYYPNNDSTPYVGEIGKADVSDFDKSVDLATGLTNDTTPSLEFSLDKALASNQQLVVIRHTIANGTRASSEDLSTKLGDTKGKTAFSFTDDELAQTYGTEYEYEVKVLTDGVVTSTATHAIRLDTIVEAMKVKTFNVAKDGTATLIFEASNNSEVNAKIKVTYPKLSGDVGEANAVANADGTYTLSLTDFDRYNAQGIKMTVIDGAGNINTNKVMAIRNLFTALTTEKGPNMNNHDAFDDPLVSASAAKEQSRIVVDKNNGGLTMSDGNDTLIIGLDNFGIMDERNGSIGDAQTYAVINATPFNLDTGAGDDFVYVRGTAQNLGTNNKISMGEGNDKLTFAKELAFGSMNVNMGEGNNIMEVLGELGIAQAGTRDFTFGDGNDSMFVSSNFDGSKTVNFGHGYNKLHVGGDLTGSGTVTFGEGDDILLVGKGMGAARALGDKNEINMGAGDDYLEVSGTSYRGLINMGEGNDKVKLAKLYDDSAHATHQYDGGTNSDGSAENDVLVLSAEDSYHVLFFKNFETVDLTAASKQTLTLTIDGLTRDNTKSIDILGGAEDKVELSGKGWAQTGQSKQVDGQTLYEYTNSGVSDEHIWIQSGIQVTL